MQIIYTNCQRSYLLLVLFLLAGLSSHAQNGGVTTTQSFTYTGQIETFTVPQGVISLTIQARGAEGAAGQNSGKGAIIQGTVIVTPGQTLSVLAGGQPRPLESGGGGGSFVVTTVGGTLRPLVIAGGGGGGGNQTLDSPTKHGQAGNAGGAATNFGGAGGSAGNGGQAGSGSYPAAGGGGLLTDGRSTTGGGGALIRPGGAAFVNGGRGGGQDQGGYSGGFGGGGASYLLAGSGFASYAGGGGGGYSGGGGASAEPDSQGGYGGGGGSYNAGTNQLSLTGATQGNTGNGLITITYVLPCPPLIITRQPASSSTVCAGSPVSTFVTVDGPATAYQWYKGTTLLSSQTSATLTLPSAQTTDSGSYSVVVSSDCRSLTSTAFNLMVNPIPPTPTLLTQTGQSYPGGQSNVSVDVNSGNVNLVVGNCSTGTISWSGPGNSSGNSSPITVSTDRVGRYVYTATCTLNGCTSPAASATVTVQGRLTVLHRDVDNYADNNAIQPLLVLQNQGNSTLPLSRLTLRYYLTVEGSSALGNLFVNYAQVGNQNVRLRYVGPAQPGGQGYVEVGFTTGAGSLAAGANSGPIQSYFAKSDYGSLFEPDDYSYNPVRDQLTATQRITAYYDGVLISGIEPGSNATVRAVRALTESRNGPSATQISTVLEVRNEGNIAINYSDLRARYYFTSDGAERLQVELDEGNVSAQLVALNQPVGGANYYLEIRYNQGGQLAPGASTGAIRYRISKPDGGRFDQANDYSYQEQPAERSQNSRVVVLVGQEVVWGTPPAGAPSARIATSPEPGSVLSVRVLGNPLEGDQLRVEILGAQGQPLRLSVSDLSGRVIGERQIDQASAVEYQSLNVSRAAVGVLLLQVSTPAQHQAVKVLKGQ